MRSAFDDSSTVGSAVANPDDEDALPAKLQRRRGVDVVVGVDRLTGERSRELGQARVPVVSVGHDQQIEPAFRARLVEDAPAAVLLPRGMRHAVAELDVGE